MKGNVMNITDFISLLDERQLLSNASSFWSFDNNTKDSLSILNGIPINSPTYKSPGINGYGSALLINRTNQQFVNVSTYRNLSYRSFTVEMWFNSDQLTMDDYGLFGQCDSPSLDHSLHYVIRNFNLHLGFYNDDLSSLTLIEINSWYHVAFVYDYPTSNQIIYLNGKIDCYQRSLGPYEGTSGSIVIGKVEQSPGSPHYFSG